MRWVYGRTSCVTPDGWAAAPPFICAGKAKAAAERSEPGCLGASRGAAELQILQG